MTGVKTQPATSYAFPDVVSNISTRPIRISVARTTAPVWRLKGAADSGKEQAHTGRAAWGVLGSAAGGRVSVF